MAGVRLFVEMYGEYNLNPLTPLRASNYSLIFAREFWGRIVHPMVAVKASVNRTFAAPVNIHV